MTLSVASAGGKVEPPEGWRLQVVSSRAHDLGPTTCLKSTPPAAGPAPGPHALRCYRHQAWPLYPAVLGEAKERLVHWASRQVFYLDSKQTKAERRGDHKLIHLLMSWEPQISASSQWGNRQGWNPGPSGHLCLQAHLLGAQHYWGPGT